LNVGAICLIYILSYGTLRTVRTRTLPDETEPKDVKAHQEERISGDSTLLLDANTALNITLFPPLFFFSALFYTDVISTLLVLLSYGLLLRKKSAPGSISDTISAILVGVIALFFRQTNIFWVAVFPAGLTVIDALKMSAPLSSDRNAKHAVKTAQDSWEDGIIHDCAVQDAGLQGAEISLHRHSNMWTNHGQTTCCSFLQSSFRH
jgi:alpha-1,2-glucosyltransferase